MRCCRGNAMGTWKQQGGRRGGEGGEEAATAVCLWLGGGWCPQDCDSWLPPRWSYKQHSSRSQATLQPPGRRAGLLTEGSRRSSSPSFLHRPIVEVSSPASPSGEVLGAGSVNKKWGVGKSEPREHRVDDWEPWTGRHGNRFRPSPGLRAALPRSVTCPPPGLRDMTSGVTVSPQERILSFMLDLKVDFKGVKTYNL